MLLDNFKESKITAGLDIPFYRDKNCKKKHIFFKKLRSNLQKKIKFDLVNVFRRIRTQIKSYSFF